MKTGFERMDNAQVGERVDLNLLYMYDYSAETKKMIIARLQQINSLAVLERLVADFLKCTRWSTGLVVSVSRKR